MSDVKDGSIQYLERKFAPEIEELRRELDRVTGLFEQANSDRDRLKHDLEMEKLAREDADRRFSESAMALSHANLVIERVRAAVKDCQ